MLLVTVLILATAVLRVGLAIEGLPNFMPLMAIALVGSAVVDRKYYWLFPLAVLLVSDVVLNAHYGVALLHPWTVVAAGLYLGAALYGRSLRNNPSTGNLLASCFAGTTTFYLVSNSLVFATSAQYAKTFAGWLQALTVGLPGFPPTWMFYRNSLIADLGFAVVVLAGLKIAGKLSAATPQNAAA